MAKRICTQRGRVVYNRDPTPFRWSDVFRIVSQKKPATLLEFSEALAMFRCHLDLLVYVATLGPRSFLELLSAAPDDDAEKLSNLVTIIKNMQEISDIAPANWVAAIKKLDNDLKTTIV